MKKVVFKYELGAITLVPTGVVRHIGFQNGRIFAWVEHAEDAGLERRLYMRVTGEVFDDDAARQFVGTAVSDNFVAHIYADTVWL